MVRALYTLTRDTRFKFWKRKYDQKLKCNQNRFKCAVYINRLDGRNETVQNNILDNKNHNSRLSLMNEREFFDSFTNNCTKNTSLYVYERHAVVFCLNDFRL